MPCCDTWIEDSFYQEFDGQGSEWNGPAALAFRESILDGSFRYCKRQLCKVPLVDSFSIEKGLIPEAPISPENLIALQAGKSEMPGGPSSFTINNDPRCNLACPSCRQEKIVKINSEQQAELDYCEEQLRRFSSSVEVIRIGNGEMLFSPWLKDLIKRLDKKNYPKLKHIYAFSNGLLFNERNYENLQPGISFLKWLSVSVDAGNSEVYSRVRGGDWLTLTENMKFVSKLKEQKKLKYFQLNFLVRKANYHTIPEFVSWSKQFAISNIKFNPFLPIYGMGVSSYEAEAVHLPSHPEYAELMKIRDSLKFDQAVRWALPE